MQHLTFPEFSFLGSTVQGVTKADLLSVIGSTIESGIENCIIGNHNLHSLYLIQHNQEMKTFYEMCNYTLVDGMSLIMLGRLMGLPLRRSYRTAYLDCFDELFGIAEAKSWRLYFLGGQPKTAAQLPARLLGMFPNLLLKCHHGYDAFAPDTTVYDEIAEFRPHIVFVGMGMPLQEKWILGARERIHTNVLVPCGGTIDYYAGAQRPSPRWLGQIGLEWLFRLCCRPRTLGSRYILEPLSLSSTLLKELVARRFQPGKS